MTMAEVFLLVWACVVTYLWQREAGQHRYFMRKTAEVIEDVVEGKAKFVVKANDEGGKTFTLEKVQ